MWQLEGATQDPERYRALTTVMSDSTETTAAAMQALAQKYLVANKAWRLQVLPAPAVPPSASESR